MLGIWPRAMMVRGERKSWRGQVGRQDLMTGDSGAEGT